jgi:hypothetical protein
LPGIFIPAILFINMNKTQEQNELKNQAVRSKLDSMFDEDSGIKLSEQDKNRLKELKSSSESEEQLTPLPPQLGVNSNSESGTTPAKISGSASDKYINKRIQELLSKPEPKAVVIEHLEPNEINVPASFLSGSVLDDLLDQYISLHPVSKSELVTSKIKQKLKQSLLLTIAYAVLQQDSTGFCKVKMHSLVLRSFVYDKTYTKHFNNILTFEFQTKKHGTVSLFQKTSCPIGKTGHYYHLYTLNQSLCSKRFENCASVLSDAYINKWNKRMGWAPTGFSDPVE